MFYMHFSILTGILNSRFEKYLYFLDTNTKYKYKYIGLFICTNTNTLKNKQLQIQIILKEIEKYFKYFRISFLQHSILRFKTSNKDPFVQS